MVGGVPTKPTKGLYPRQSQPDLAVTVLEVLGKLFLPPPLDRLNTVQLYVKEL